MSISTHHLDTTKQRSVWITHNARKWSRDTIRRSFICGAFLTETLCRTMKCSPASCKMGLVLQPLSSWARHNSCELDHGVHFSWDLFCLEEVVVMTVSFFITMAKVASPFSVLSVSVVFFYNELGSMQQSINDVWIDIESDWVRSCHPAWQQYSIW